MSEREREGLFCFNVFESGICGQLGFFFFSLPPLIYTVCSETHQGLFGLGVCFGDRPRISALRVGTAISAAPGGPAGHKTSRGLLAPCFILLSPPLLPLLRVRLPAEWTSPSERELSEARAGVRWVEKTERRAGVQTLGSMLF